MIARLQDQFAERFEQRGARLEVQGDLPWVVAAPGSLERAFENLIANALAYACDGPDALVEVGGEVVRRRLADDPEIRYFVRDHGPGIAEEYHDRIFQLFQRLDTTVDGTGVGLASVAKVAHTHGGRVWVESAPGAGATFRIALPRPVDASPPEAHREQGVDP